MIRALLIAPSEDLAAALEPRFAAPGAPCVLKHFRRYPAIEDLAGAIRAHEPHAVFVDIAGDPTAIRVAGEMQRRWPAVTFVAIDRQPDPNRLVDLLRAGVREFLAAPFPQADFAACIDRIRADGADAGHNVGDPAIDSSTLSNHPHSHRRHASYPDAATNAVYAFLPAKPGAGASTLAINTALAFARLGRHRTLLADCDLGCGVTAFHLKVHHPYSMQDALERASILEPGLWADLVAPCGEQAAGPGAHLDLLPTVPPGPFARPSPAAVSPLIEFARRAYDTILLDCSGDLDLFTLELLAQCRRILLVVEPDMTTVHLGREKTRVLRAAELDDRVELVINRWRKQNLLSLPDIESVFGIAAEYIVPDDPKSAYRGVLRGSGADPLSPLGKACTAIQESLGSSTGSSEAVARLISGNHHQQQPQPQQQSKRMVEYFSVSPARYSLFPNGGDNPPSRS